MKSENNCEFRDSTILNCKIYKPDQDNVCEECDPNFTLSESKSQCYQNFVDCEINSENSEKNGLVCGKCKDGYYWDSATSKCIKGDSTLFCKIFTNASTCEVCINEYYFDQNQCKKHNTIDFCSAYSNETKDTCLECSKDYYLFQIENHCAEVVDEIGDCAVYESDGQCKICKDGFAVLTPKIC